MNKYFKSKAEFKKEFSYRLKNKYLTTVNKSSVRERYKVLSEMVMDYLSDDWMETEKKTDKEGLREVYYFSMEFLLGRLITSNIESLGLMPVIEDGFTSFHIKLSEVLEYEKDPGLGNGGLGRLAACYLDSLASLSYPGYGNCIRYRYGLFRQKIKNGYQEERPDDWLSDGFSWEIRREELSEEIPFYGYVDQENGKRTYHPSEYIKAVPYDVPIVGYKNNIVNRLRLWNAEPARKYPYNKSAFEYETDLRKICGFLYPDDSSDDGKRLRLVQQYFFSSAGIKSLCREKKNKYGSLKDLDKYVVIHINDTHPTLVIPELMRILIDEENMEWDEAYKIVANATCYTNHSLLREAMEHWNVSLIRDTLPRIMEIIDEINKRFVDSLYALGKTKEYVNSVAIVKDNIVYMANLCAVVTYSVNGVAKLHTELLKTQEMKEFNELFPGKFKNVTNGITPRRWVMYSNKELSGMLNEYTEGWDKDIKKISSLTKYLDNRDLQDTYFKIKTTKKELLSKLINETDKTLIHPLSPDFIFDVQIKRLHEYKRQLLNALHIIYLYDKIKNDESFRNNYCPHAFIFGAKAASGYYFAKKIIKLINTIAKKIDADEEVAKYLRVVFVENYNVSLAEKIIPSIDVSEQISLSGYEASGTGNMKAMMNGAVTVGTMDGANIEIFDEVGDDNIIIFGLNAKEVKEKKASYNPREIYNANSDLKKAVDSLINGFFTDIDPSEFKEIYDKLLNEDPYMVLIDFESYKEAQEKVNTLYKDKAKWAKMGLMNIAKSGVFSSDRAINEYVSLIWHIDKIQ